MAKKKQIEQAAAPVEVAPPEPEPDTAAAPKRRMSGNELGGLLRQERRARRFEEKGY